MRVSVALMAAVLALGAPTNAVAAAVQPDGGSVSINGARPVATQSQVKTGDTVTTGPSRSAKIVYDNGCVITVEPGSTVTVVADEQCALPAAGLSGTTVASGG